MNQLNVNNATVDDYYRSENILDYCRWNDPFGMLKEFGINHHDPINPEHLLSLLEGKSPLTNESLFKKENEMHMTGTEIEASVPKEVSALWAAPSTELRDLIDKSIQEANESALDFLHKNSN